VVTASADRTVRIWDAKTGKQVTEPLCNDHCAQFSPDGLRMVTTSRDNTVRLWNPQPGQALTEPLRHEGWVHAAQFSPDGRRIVTATQDGTSRVWMPDARRNRDPSRTGYHGAAQVWDAQTGKPVTAPLPHEGDVNSAEFSPDGRRVVTGAQDETARVWDAQTGEPLTEPLRHDLWVRSARFSPDGKRVVTGAGAFLPGRGYAQVWDAQTGEALTEPLRHQAMVVYAQFSPDGRRVVTASEDETARVWDAQTGQPLTEPLRHGGYVKSAQFSRDGLRVVTASWDTTARVWDAQSGKPLTAPLVHQGEVYSARFSPDGLRVVTAAKDGTARVWDAQSGHPLSEPLRHEAQVWSAEFSPDGLQVVTASEDRTARVWRMPFGAGPAPSWLPRLAVSIAGKRLAGTRIFEPVGPEEFLKLQKQLTHNAGTNDYAEWAKWFCADRSTRTISPLSRISVPEYVQRRIGEETLESLREAVSLSPANGLAFARLARQVLTQNEQANPCRTGEADFFSRRAAELSPNDPEVQHVRAEILRQVNNIPWNHAEITR
jgi:WD40 repeat protein